MKILNCHFILGNSSLQLMGSKFRLMRETYVIIENHVVNTMIKSKQKSTHLVIKMIIAANGGLHSKRKVSNIAFIFGVLGGSRPFTLIKATPRNRGVPHKWYFFKGPLEKSVEYLRLNHSVSTSSSEFQQRLDKFRGRDSSMYLAESSGLESVIIKEVLVELRLLKNRNILSSKHW